MNFKTEQEIQLTLRAFCHDIGASLRSAQGFSSLLLERKNELLDEKSCRWLKLIKESGEHGQKISSALHSYARLFALEQDKLPVNLESIAKDVASNLQAQHPCLNYTIATLPTIQGYAPLWHMFFDALLLNVVTHGSEDDSLSLHCYISSTHKDGTVTILIDDDGQGIKNGHYEQALQPFHSLNSSKLHAGFGLNICQRITELHDGELALMASPYKGLRVSATLAV